MKFDIGTRSAAWLSNLLHDVLQPEQESEQTTAATRPRIGQLTRRGLAVVLSALMIMIPMGMGEAFAQSAPPVGDSDQQVTEGQPLSAGQLDQLVAPIALYPDALVAQLLVAATYPTEVVEANRWCRAQGSAAPEQIAAAVENQDWDPSVKALTAFPTVLAQMDRNLQWTTDLGNAYYNQPQDVMDSVQAMRHKAELAGQLRSTPQQAVSNDDGAITIAPANPTVVYVPVYNPWTVYGAPLPMYPGYYYAPSADVFWGGLAIGFGVGIGIGYLAHQGWGWGHWGMGWGSHAVLFNHGRYFTHSTTVINHGFNRPGGPGRNFGARGAYARTFNRAGEGFNRSGYRGAYGANRPGGTFARPGGTMNRPSSGYRGAYGANRPSGTFARPGGTMNRPSSSYRGAYGANRPSSPPVSRGAFSASRSGGNFSRPRGGANFPKASTSHGSGINFGGGHPSGGGHSAHLSGGHPRASSVHSSGGHSNHSAHRG